MKRILVFCAVLCRILAKDLCHETDLDAASKSYLSPGVFSGIVVSSLVSNKTTIVDFRVKRLLKKNGFQVSSNDIVLEYRKRMAACLNDFQLGKLYIVFVRRNKRKEIVPSFPPVLSNKKTMKKVRRILCPKCEKPPSVRALSDVTVEAGKRFMLQCKVDGNPLPSIEWYRDERKLDNKGRIKIVIKRKSSRLVIKSARQRDQGQYECRARNVVAKNYVSLAANVTIVKKTTTIIPELQGTPCGKDSEGFCLNGGNCTFYQVVGEYVCKCADGFKGHRCDHKNVAVFLGEVNHRRREQRRQPSYFGTIFGTSIFVCVIFASLAVYGIYIRTSQEISQNGSSGDEAKEKDASVDKTTSEGEMDRCER